MPRGRLADLRGRHRRRGTACRSWQNRRLVLDSRDLPFRCTLECQNFRPPDERELTFSAYGHQGTDVCGVDLETKKVTNYSDAPDQYDEPEGIFPDGQWTLVECDREGLSGKRAGARRHLEAVARRQQDLGAADRTSTSIPGYKASNPVVSDDGRFMAFQMARSRDPAGVGYGIFLYDLSKRPPGASNGSSGKHLGPRSRDHLPVLDVKRCWLRSQLTQSRVQLEGSFSFWRTPKSWSPVA